MRALWSTIAPVLIAATLLASLSAVSAPDAGPAANEGPWRVLVLKPTGPKFSAADRETFAGLIAAAFARRPQFDVISASEIKRLANLSAEQQRAGCQADTCLADLAQVMNAALVVFGNVNRLGDLVVFNLSLYNAAQGRAVGRASVQAERVEQLPSKLRQASDQLVHTLLRGVQLSADCPSDMARIPAGQFFMGADDDDTDRLLQSAKPSHNVTLPAFCFDMTEVTTRAYERCVQQGKCRRAGKTVKFPGIKEKNRAAYNWLCNTGHKERLDHPINCVTWKMAARYCAAQGKRLPTEAEWEYATRGPDGRKFPWGDDAPTANDVNACGAECVAWGEANGIALRALYKGDDGHATTAPVGSYPAGDSRFGPHDVAGNVWEWVADWWAPYSEADVVSPTGPTKGKKRVIRGGAFNASQASWLRPAFRFGGEPHQRSHAIGFRCAKSLASASQ